MANKIIQRLEVLANEIVKNPIPPDVEEAFRERWTRHSFSAHLDADDRARNLFFPGDNICKKTELIVLTGVDSTDDSGKATIPISSLLCDAGIKDFVHQTSGRFVLIQEPSFLATPQSSSPTFATAQANVTVMPLGNGEFLFHYTEGRSLSVRKYLSIGVDVTTWKPNGTVAANTKFSWICMTEAAILTNIGG
jgi:hypothetical protein